MRSRVWIGLSAIVAVILAVASWWDVSRSDHDVLSSKQPDDVRTEKSSLAPPVHSTPPTQRETLVTDIRATAANEVESHVSDVFAPTVDPLVVTVKLAGDAPELANAEFQLFAIDPAAPLIPYAGTTARLGEPTAVTLPADLDIVQLQLVHDSLVLDPDPRIRRPAGKAIEVAVEARGQLFVHVVEPWLSRPDLMVYAAGSDRRDIWTEVMEGRGRAPDQHGECRFDALPPGNYLVQMENSVTKEGGALKRVVRVRSGKTTRIEIGGPDPAPLTFEGVARRGSQPAAGETVYVGSFEQAFGVRSVTDSYGRFHAALPAEGRYHFRFGESERFEEWRDIDALGTQQQFALPNERLCAVVRDVDGALLAGAKVRLHALSTPELDPHRFLGRVLETQTDGSACFEGLAPGRYLLTLGAARDPFSIDVLGSPVQLEVDVPRNGVIPLFAATPHTLLGTAQFENGDPAFGLNVYLRPTALPNASWQDHSNVLANGDFEAAWIAEGEYELLLVSRNGSITAASKIQRVRMPRAEPSPIAVTVEPGTRLIVDARDHDGTPLRIRLGIWTADGIPWPHDGMHGQWMNRQTCFPLPRGTYDVYGYTSQGGTLHARVDVDGSLEIQRVVLTR